MKSQSPVPGPMQTREQACAPATAAEQSLGTRGSDWNLCFERLRARIAASGVAVHQCRLGPQTTGVFDGLSITTNSDCDLPTQCHNLGHAFGHIVQWSVSGPGCQRLYDALYAAKEAIPRDCVRLERALAAFREYEEEASQLAAWLLVDTGSAWALDDFTLFARADIEAIISYHRTGVAPIWAEFFADWRTRTACGEIAVVPFSPKPIPCFAPISISPQEVIRAIRE